jgi:hypothetical protein
MSEVERILFFWQASFSAAMLRDVLQTRPHDSPVRPPPDAKDDRDRHRRPLAPPPSPHPPTPWFTPPTSPCSTQATSRLDAGNDNDDDDDAAALWSTLPSESSLASCRSQTASMATTSTLATTLASIEGDVAACAS